MNARAVTTELAAKIRGPTLRPGAQPLQVTHIAVGPGQLGGFMAEVIFSFEDYHLVGKSAACATRKEAQEEACEKIRADLQGIWDMRDRTEKLRIPCMICLELMRPHMVGEHMMFMHSEAVIEASGRAGDATYQQTVTDAIGRMKAHRQQ